MLERQEPPLMFYVKDSGIFADVVDRLNHSVMCSAWFAASHPPAARSARSARSARPVRSGPPRGADAAGRRCPVRSSPPRGRWVGRSGRPPAAGGARAPAPGAGGGAPLLRVGVHTRRNNHGVPFEKGSFLTRSDFQLPYRSGYRRNPSGKRYERGHFGGYVWVAPTPRSSL